MDFAAPTTNGSNRPVTRAMAARLRSSQMPVVQYPIFMPWYELVGIAKGRGGSVPSTLRQPKKFADTPHARYREAMVRSRITAAPGALTGIERRMQRSRRSRGMALQPVLPTQE